MNPNSLANILAKLHRSQIATEKLILQIDTQGYKQSILIAVN